MGTALDALLERMGSGAVAWKRAVRAVATSNITLSGTQTIDGVVLVVGDRVLLTGQTTASQNGIYTVASGSWARAADLNRNRYAHLGMMVPVLSGTINAVTLWQLTSPANTAIALGVTSLTFTKILTGSLGTASTLDYADGVDGSNVEDASAESKVVVQTAAGISGFEGVRTKSVARKTSGTLRVEGQAGVVISHGADDVATATFSGGLSQLATAGPLRVSTTYAKHRGGLFIVEDTAGRELFRFYAGLVSPPAITDFPSDDGIQMFQDIVSSAGKGHLKALSKFGMFEDLMFEAADATGTSKPRRKAFQLKSVNTVAQHTLATIASSKLPSGNCCGYAEASWGGFDTTAGAAASGRLSAQIYRAGGGLVVDTSPTDQPVGFPSFIATDLDDTGGANPPQIYTDGSAVMVKLATKSTHTFKLHAALEVFLVEH